MDELQPNVVFHGRHFVRHIGICTPICVKLFQFMSGVIWRHLRKKLRLYLKPFSWRSQTRHIHTHRQTDRHTHTQTHIHTYTHKYFFQDGRGSRKVNGDITHFFQDGGIMSYLLTLRPILKVINISCSKAVSTHLPLQPPFSPTIPQNPHPHPYPANRVKHLCMLLC